MRIFVARESDPAEPRVAATPETVKKMTGLGAEVTVEPGAGVKSGILDADYTAAGATLSDGGKDADIVLRVRRPSEAEIAGYKPGALVIAVMDPFGNDAALAAMARAGLTAFAMELMPRITRAQSMDVLSSQANLGGYRAVIDGAAEYGRALPMMMTAAGTVPAAKVFVMGAGVAGLQAIATARRLGAVVTATDVRPAAKEQVQSLGAKFIAVEDEEFKQAETAGGYAKEMSKDYQAKQAALVAEHIKKQDIVVTTALIPGRPAPRLISAAMVASMRPGLGDRRPCGRARRQCRGREARRGRRGQRGEDRRHQQSGPAPRLGVDALCQEPLHLPRDPDRQEDQGSCGQFRRRARQGDASHPRRRRGPSEFPAQIRCLRLPMATISPEEAANLAQAAAEVARQAAQAAQGYADVAAQGVHVATGGAIDPFVFRLSIFVLAVFVGYYVVWSVTPALHTPLMSVTNAISSVIVVGALLAVGVSLVGNDGGVLARALGFVALVFASINIFGGFLVTQRMLAMYQKKKK